jgi:hypothetical protein
MFFLRDALCSRLKVIFCFTEASSSVVVWAKEDDIDVSKFSIVVFVGKIYQIFFIKIC